MSRHNWGWVRVQRKGLGSSTQIQPTYIELEFEKAILTGSLADLWFRHGLKQACTWIGKEAND